MKIRLAIRIAAVSLALLVGIGPCVFMTMGLRAEEAHDCCDDSSEHSSSHKTICDLLCVFATIPATVSQQHTVHKYELIVGPPSPPLTDQSPTERPRVGILAALHSPDRSPPLYVLHGAFLI